jgi:hypothetical protein
VSDCLIGGLVFCRVFWFCWLLWSGNFAAFSPLRWVVCGWWCGSNFFCWFGFCIVSVAACCGAFLHRVWDNAVPQQHPAIVNSGATVHRALRYNSQKVVETCFIWGFCIHS